MEFPIHVVESIKQPCLLLLLLRHTRTYILPAAATHKVMYWTSVGVQDDDGKPIDCERETALD